MPFVGGTGTELFAGNTIDELGSVADTGTELFAGKAIEEVVETDDDTPVESETAMLELTPVPIGVVVGTELPVP